MTEAAAGKADIVERLNNRVHDSHMANERLMDEAAAEIASLRGYREMDKAHVQACENAMMREKDRAETADRELAKAMEARAAETQRADDNSRTCHGFADALRRIAAGEADPSKIASEILSKPRIP